MRVLFVFEWTFQKYFCGCLCAFLAFNSIPEASLGAFSPLKTAPEASHDVFSTFGSTPEAFVAVLRTAYRVLSCSHRSHFCTLRYQKTSKLAAISRPRSLERCRPKPLTRPRSLGKCCPRSPTASRSSGKCRPRPPTRPRGSGKCYPRPPTASRQSKLAAFIQWIRILVRRALA